jgi:hypothetical protein
MAVTINASTTAGLVQTADTSGVLQLQTNSGTTALTIDTSQNVGIGTTSPTLKFQVNGQVGINTGTTAGANGSGIAIYASDFPRLSFRNSTTGDANTDGLQIYMVDNDVSYNLLETGYQRWLTGNTERMRIDSSGNFLVGTTTGLDGGNGATIKQASYYISSYRVSSTAGNYVHAFYSDVGGTATAKYAIYANGTAGAISDERYKKNIEPSRNYLDDLTKIDVIKYNWVTDEDGTPKELGFSAQQVETIFPALVDTVDNKDADGNVLSNQKILKRDVFLPMLVKAIQEQQTIINDLKARITALEGAA